ncbi:pseudouridine synthase [Papillibacter cinnamivorans]|uniref:Pseudouridine synthase n=1 Tax=Papillibacter cinnamivorans DSM 12816 TaxID=1122930 RepID=A0A1W1ZF13_9FIRM|nr:pseudouridine synthase [Papillibacter cinnamivorans]SMC46936.1 16S rRNA pseudouridine516 synthase [Papillibacter cinnamivorans DSM 12816]
MKKQRLDRILASTGIVSRKEAKEMICAGRVRTDGKILSSPEKKLDPETAALTVDGTPLSYREFYYIMLNKPAGVISATEDPREKTAVDLLPERLRRVGLFPAGRLDKDTEGLLLLTSDGQTAHALTAPRRHVDKVYFVRTDLEMTAGDEDAFREGIVLSDGTLCLPAELSVLPDTAGREARVTLREGKFHQVKRMLLSRGKTVVFLKRLSMGSLVLDPTLGPGEYRELTETEIASIRSPGKEISLSGKSIRKDQ